MLKALGKTLRRFNPQSASLRNVLKLAGGTAGSQVITVAAAPILTRLYGPESFGVLATFVSTLTLLNVLSSLRYEFAIAVPEDDDEAIVLVWLCIGLVAISTCLTALGVTLLGDQVVGLLRQPALKPLLWLLPVGVFITGVYQPLSFWAIRRKQFGLLAQTKFWQSSLALVTNISTASIGTAGLLMGHIIGQGSGSFSIIINSISTAPSSLIPGLFLVKLKSALIKYKGFAIYSSPSGLINAAGNQIPVIMFAASYGLGPAGQLAFAIRLFSLPNALIGTSVSQVFLSQAAECHRLNTLTSLVTRLALKLFWLGIIASIMFCTIVPPMVPILFGSRWNLLANLFPLLIPLSLGQLIVSSLSMAFIVAEKTKSELLAQLGQAFIRLFMLICAIASHASFLNSVSAYSFGSLMGYLFYGQTLFLALKSEKAVYSSSQARKLE